ncbi:MAG: UDP-N-acetylglucosamine 2-epimerase (non-hydrolyzing) [Candidatus Eremiobacteraeota bacterium]|nr:UDP-N-acetylglucosamine 2-epimerase (non-hydrolyzing) [Candidatus Eremiobacteraeota bacterium]
MTIATACRLRVMTVFGTRPDTIKMAPVVSALEAHPGIESIVCVTAQHRKMLDDLLKLFAIEPHYDLDIMTADQTLTQITTRVLAGMEGVLAHAKPDVVLVHGDTGTSTAAALAAFYAHIPVGHVEAGLRTGDRWMPFPEEMNRRVTGAIASYHFAPTALAREHLLRENIASDAVIVTGNTVIDAFLATAGRRDLPAPPGWNAIDPDRPAIVVTAHRRENHPFMRAMCEAMRDISELPSRPQIYWPVHPSPHVLPIATEVLAGVPGIVLVEPVDYAQMVSAVKAATFVLTDSGGLQEEAPTLGKPVLVMRDETERPEGLDAGTLQLVGHDRGKIVVAARRLLTDPAAYAQMSRAVNPYGDGHAAARIVDWLSARLQGGVYPDAFSMA